MSLESWDPDHRLREFRRKSNAALDELLANLSGTTEGNESITFQPEVDVVETADEFRFYVSVPGIIEDDLLINIEGRRIIVRGERHPPYDAAMRGAAVQEWRYGFFERQFELSSLIAVTSIRAAYDAGVLTIIAEKLNAPRDQEGGQS